jgi:hypothetical protein
MTKTATELRDKRRTSGTGAAHRLYRLSEPLEGNEYVVVSAVTLSWVGLFNGPGPETYIFPATRDGDITDWIELEGSFQGDLDHEQALKNAGYEVKL